MPKPNSELKPFDAALLTEACCVLINGAAEQADVGQLVQVLASFKVDQSLDSKLAAIKHNVPNFKPSSSEVASVLVLELISSDGTRAIPVRLARALSDLCQVLKIVLVLDECMTAFRVGPDTLLSQSLGLQSTLVAFSKAVYPAGVLACTYPNRAGAFAAIAFKRLYPKKHRTAFCTATMAEEMERVLRLMTPLQILRNWHLGWYIREHLRRLIPRGCTHYNIRGCGLLMHSNVPLARCPSLVLLYNRLLPKFDLTVPQVHEFLKGGSSTCRLCSRAVGNPATTSLECAHACE